MTIPTTLHRLPRTIFAAATSLCFVAPAFAQSAPAAEVEKTSSAAPAPSTLNWFGFGLRLGSGKWDLKAEPVRESLRDRAGDEGLGNVDADRFTDSKDSMTFITPTLHMGGKDFFFKLEAPIGRSAAYQSFGLGLYPLNYGHYFASTNLFPYVSTGLVGHYLQSQERELGAAGGGEAKGGMLQARLGVGLKWRPIEMLSLSFEIGYSPWALGFIGTNHGNQTVTIPGTEGVVADVPDVSVAGGKGQVIDFSVGIELL